MNNPAFSNVISIHPQRVSGKPCFAGTRVPIQNLYDYLEGGETIEDFLEGFLGVTSEQVVEVLHEDVKRKLNP